MRGLRRLGRFMNLLRKITSSKFFNLEIFSFIIFIVIHIGLFNVNTAEWGDSYRILRASEFIRNWTYPSNEKRPPLFSIFTALRPVFIEPVIWGRVVMLIFSILSFLLFSNLVKMYIKNQKYRFLATMLFIFNPIYLYWSIRIMADVPFSFFVMLGFFISKKMPDNSIKKYILLGLISGLSILTRFEGYLFLISLLAGAILNELNLKIDLKKVNRLVPVLFSQTSKNWKKIITLGVTALITIFPWILYRNPFDSSYFGETTRRIYDLKMVWVYLVSLLFSLGFVVAFYFIFRGYRIIGDFFSKNVDIALFTILELVLILLWPSAVPRLFVVLMPLFILILTKCIENNLELAENVNKKKIISNLVFPFLLLVFVLSQYFLRLQFLITDKILFGLLVFIQIVVIFSYILKKKILFLTLIVTSNIVWSLSIIFMHKDIYTAIKSAAIYSRDKLDGNIIYNDTASVADWYINYYNPREGLTGKKMNFMIKDELRYNSLSRKKVSYVIATNENGALFYKDIDKLEYLKLIKSFRYNIGDKELFANIYKFER